MTRADAVVGTRNVAQATKIYYIVRSSYDSFQAIIKGAVGTQEAWLSPNRWEMPKVSDLPFVALR